MFQSVGIAYPDPSVAFLLAVVSPWAGLEIGFVGATITCTPPSSNGPIYFDDFGALDPTLTATTAFSIALATFVPPGEVLLVYGGATSTCLPNFGGWPASAANGVRVPVRAGFETHVGQRCQ